MRIFFRNACLSVCLFPLLLSVPSFADPILAPASALVQIEVGHTFESHPGLSPYQDWNNQSLGQSSSSFNVNVSGGNMSGASPEVLSQIGFDGVPANQPYQVTSQMSYEFAISGPAGQTVPVDIASSGNALVTTIVPGFFSAAALNIFQQGNSTALVSAAACAGNFTGATGTGGCGNAPSTSSGSFNIDPTLTLQTDTIYIVDLNSEVLFDASTSDSPGNYFGLAGVDPTITLDTSDPAYSLVLSPGLEPTPTPEPGTLALTGSGLLTALAFVRRRGFQKSLSSLTTT